MIPYRTNCYHYAKHVGFSAPAGAGGSDALEQLL